MGSGEVSVVQKSMGIRAVVWVSVILTVALFLRLASFNGIVASDDVSIANLAIRLLEEGPWVPQGHYAARIGLIYPVAGIFSVFGVGELQTVIIPFLLSLFSVYLAYLIGRRLADEPTGILAAAAIAVFPLDIKHASMLMPDLPLGTLLAAAFYLTLRALDSEKPAGWGISAGLVWGLAYLVKIEAAFFALVLGFLLLTQWGRWRTFLWIAVACAVIVVGENLIYFLAGGEILHRVDAVTHQGGGKAVEAFSGTQLWVYPKAWFITIYSFGLHYYFLLASLLWIVFYKMRNLYVIAVWVVVYLLWLQFGGNPLSETYQVKSHLLRYCEMITVPMGVAIGAMLAYMARKSKTLFNIAATALIFVGLFFANFGTLSYERQRATKIALDYARDNDLFPLYTDRTSRALASIYMYNDLRVSSVLSLQHHDFRSQETDVMSLNEIDQGYVLLNRGFMEYGWNRYRVDQVTVDSTSDFEPVFVVDNPGNSLAYAQTRLLSSIAQIIPVAFLRDKIKTTADAILQSEDVVLYKKQS